MPVFDIDAVLRDLTTDEKVTLLAGVDTWSTAPIERREIPSIKVSDGPHGLRGSSFFNSQPAMLLPSGTAMGATFDIDLMHRVGAILATEAKERGVHLLLGPTVSSAYINGVQENGVGCCIKHFAAHDQSTDSTEDDVRASERTLREMHLLPFQIAVRYSDPWAFMTSYNKINGVHAAEDPWLLTRVLRDEWRSDAVTVSDWYGTYSSSSALNAGLDLEMPGPARWRGDLLRWAITSNKVTKRSLDASVRRILGLVKRAHAEVPLDVLTTSSNSGDTLEKRELCLEVASDAIVLLKNEKGVLPVDPARDCTYALIGPGVHHPAVSGGGSADLTPYYVSFPFDELAGIVGAEKIRTAIGCRGHLYTPLLTTCVTIPNTSLPGYVVEWYTTDPLENTNAEPVASTTTTEASMYFADNLPDTVPATYWLLARTKYTAVKTCTLELGLCVLGKGKLFVDGEEMIDLYTSQPPKTHPTPMFNQASMETVAELDVIQGQQYTLTIYLQNTGFVAGAGALNCGGLRIGAVEKIDPATALSEAVQLARNVDFPIVIAGLNSDYEAEAFDRTTLALPPGIDELIARVIEVNPNTACVLLEYPNVCWQ
ncbi:hypothetical protein PENSOL_c008G01088 [Penicillium solitum]|uniref:Probable beta-glucosidase I n=1 Tax=Penicillium solitum TaxID=60172 RepID=A0A1V6RBB0_9EURO|nr:uncharacterized protein PENSOL_c008G01088 [Penicillium solitum]OQD98828.1 hypothetical protein PENSOL_c008G01088 [Penicillium solitum]